MLAFTAFLGALISAVAAMWCFDLIVIRLYADDRERWVHLGRPGAFFSSIEGSTIWSGDASRKRLLWQLQLTRRHSWVRKRHLVCLRMFSLAVIVCWLLFWLVL